MAQMAEAITDTAAADHADLGFDPNALRDKYRAERDKRLRVEGNEQYVEVKDAFAHFVEDPYVEPGFDREPLTDDTDVVVIGGGFGGLLAGARLREAGVRVSAPSSGSTACARCTASRPTVSPTASSWA